MSTLLEIAGIIMTENFHRHIWSQPSRPRVILINTIGLCRGKETDGGLTTRRELLFNPRSSWVESRTLTSLHSTALSQSAQLCLPFFFFLASSFKKTEFTWIKFEDHTGFVQWFLNGAASNLADRKLPRGAVQRKDLQAEGSRKEEVTPGNKAGWLCKVTFL